jgi:hypothetical protein
LFCSTIIPTIGRPSLSRAVHSVLDQPFDADEFEIIVVNDSGHPLPGASWQRSERVRIIATNRRERSVARNAGAALARGRYLHFLDDDDVLLPGALAAFWELAGRNPDAIWLHGSYQSVDNDGAVVEEIHPEAEGNIFALLVAGESIPFQASLLDAHHFFAAGGFESEAVIIGVEDRDVGRRLAVRGRVAYTPVVVAQIRIGEQGSTTNWGVLAEGDRWGREKALRLPGSYGFIRASTGSCRVHGIVDPAGLRARSCRAYLASVVWNLERGDLLIALSRAAAGLALASRCVLRVAFWRTLLNPGSPKAP